MDQQLNFAAIDIGSNAVRLLLTRVFDDGFTATFRKMSLIRMPIRLGDDAFTHKHISEMKVMLYIIYRTFGWRKWDDWISLSQFEHGQNGRAEDQGCGLSHAAVLEGLEYAVQDGYARRRFSFTHGGER